MTPAEFKLLMVHLVRDLDTIRSASSRIRDEMFDYQTESLDAACWSVSREGFAQSGQRMPYEHFLPAVLRTMDERFPGHGMSVDQITQAVSVPFHFNDDSLRFVLAAPLLQKFLVTRSTRHTLNEIYFTGPEIELLDRLAREASAAVISSARVEDLDSLGVDVFASAVRTPTGCVPIDTLMGGIRVGETTGILGPMKGGKTSLAQSLACDFIKMGRRVTFVTYEESGRRQQWPKLLICYSGRHDRASIEGKALSDMDPEVVSDLESAGRSLKIGLTLVDMSASENRQGLGGMAELESCLEELKRRGCLGDMVIVDHAYAMVMKYLTASSLDLSKHFRLQIQDTCERFKALVERLGVCGFLLHQMDAAANKNPIRVPSHMDAAECKLFPQFLHNVICIGVKDENNIAWLNMSASRNLATSAVHVIIDGRHCRVRLAQGYAVDDRTGAFCREDDLVLGRRVEDPIRTAPSAFRV